MSKSSGNQDTCSCNQIMGRWLQSFIQSWLIIEHLICAVGGRNIKITKTACPALKQLTKRLQKEKQSVKVV